MQTTMTKKEFQAKKIALLIFMKQEYLAHGECLNALQIQRDLTALSALEFTLVIADLVDTGHLFSRRTKKRIHPEGYLITARGIQFLDDYAA